jgi:hypothetical protein
LANSPFLIYLGYCIEQDFKYVRPEDSRIEAGEIDGPPGDEFRTEEQYFEKSTLK